jgi:hypothetical protein
MPSLIDLFESKILSNGKTAEAEFEVRNSKDIRITTSDPILNSTVFPLVQKTLRNSSVLTVRKRETLAEAETTGLRVIGGLSSPVLYGTEIIRISQRTTPTLEIMKMGANGTPSDGSAFVSNIINKGTQGINNFLQNKLGVQFPTKLIPTSVSETMTKSGYAFPLTPAQLADIQNDGAGNIIGKFIQQNVQGTPSQIGRAVIGQTIRSIKDTIRQKLFNGRTEEMRRLAIIGDGEQMYNSQRKYSKTVDTSIEAGIRNDLSSVYDEKIKLIEKIPTTFLKNLSNGESLPVKLPKNKYSDKSLYVNDPRTVNNSLEGRLDMQRGSDRLNREVAWYSEDGTPPKNANDKTLDDYSMIPLRFYSISKKSGVSFRAVIDGLNETFSPSWESSKFIGNPYNFYTYNGIDRSVSFNFKIFSLNDLEHKSMWQKISFLTTMVYPQKFASPYITPPFIKFTLGDMYNNKEAYIESLSYTIDDNTPWEIGLTKSNRNFDYVDDISLKDYKLPTIISVQITLRFVESQTTHWDGNDKPKRLYDYGGVSREIKTPNERRNGINADGSAINPRISIGTGKPPRQYDMLPSEELLKTAKKNLDVYVNEGVDVDNRLNNRLSGLSIIRP